MQVNYDHSSRTSVINSDWYFVVFYPVLGDFCWYPYYLEACLVNSRAESIEQVLNDGKIKVEMVWDTPLNCITILFLSCSSNKHKKANQVICLKNDLNTLFMIEASVKDIFPKNLVKGILDFPKCGMKVGAPNFRIFRVAGIWPFSWKASPEKICQEGSLEINLVPRETCSLSDNFCKIMILICHINSEGILIV